MLFLLFQIGDDRFALDARCVVELVPLLAMKRLPGSPPDVAGAIHYRGRPVPVLDLCQLALKHPAAERLSTRIVIVQYPAGNGTMQLLGLIAERATRVFRAAPGAVDTLAAPVGAPYLGPLIMDDRGGAIQWIRHEHLLPERVRDRLFSELQELEHEAG